MTERGAFTQKEILSQPEAWASVLQVLREQVKDPTALPDLSKFDQVVWTGCGSTYYLALSAAAFFCETAGQTARAFPASELWLNPAHAYPKGSRTLLVAVSRSGETTETLKACEAFRAAGRGQIITLSNYPGTALTGLGDLNLVFPSGQEQSIAQTRAFTTLYLAAIYLVILWNGRQDWLAQLNRLPEVASGVIKAAGPLTQQLGADMALDRFYFLGSGSRYGLACEFSLKMKEMSLTHSEPFHFLEFRHGPKSMITSSALVVGLRSETLRAQEGAVLDEMRQMGARLLVIGDQNADVDFNSQVDEPLRNVLYLPVGQLLAFARSISKGLNPDKPENLGAVVRLDS